jgi:hypothetical protein
MALMSEIATDALRKIGVVAEDEQASADSIANAVRTLNQMLHGWKLRGVDLTYSTLPADATFPLDPEFEEGTVYVLAGRLSPNFQSPASFDADDWFRTIQAAYMVIEDAEIPRTLRRTSSQTLLRGYDI